MRVVISPRAEALSGDLSAVLARSLTGGAHEVAPAPMIAPTLPPRPLTPAEVNAVREALVGRSMAQWAVQPSPPSAGVFGYVCVGRRAGPGSEQTVVAVDDHVGLTWDSPLQGPNDDRLGPRFPRTDEVYAPDIVRERFPAGLGVTISVATVAGVRADDRLSAWEREMVASLGIGVVSAELVPVAVIAAHLGLHVAAAVILQG